ncbi:hypothetical protein BGAPBR_0494 [Borreliella garinii PBr]|uniref:Uncharacterized protein n=1 Tax=Borreliella garinii PBr TaxID=498743 RepID=B7XRM1_BORGR|nr:hypothetical protein BGAPBR_0494 [Borreliella garinii PBr]
MNFILIKEKHKIFKNKALKTTAQNKKYSNNEIQNNSQ